MGYEMQQSRFEAKLTVMRSKFREAAEWLEKIPREKWTQAYDGGKRYGHMTTNLAESLNSVLKGARALPILALVKTTFIRSTSLFVDRGNITLNMMKAGHIYSESLSTALHENQARAKFLSVSKFTRDFGEFEVEELANPQTGRRAMTCKVNLNTWWCDCGEFQALRYPCSHVIASCAYCNVNCGAYIDSIYTLDYIYKVYGHEFHPLGSEDYWASYSGPTLKLNRNMKRHNKGRLNITRIHNEMDVVVPKKIRKCTLCRTEGHKRNNCPYKE